MERGSQTHVNLLAPVRNRVITGGFRTSPTNAFEVEFSVLLINLFLDYLRMRVATRTAKLTPNHPIVIRLPPAVCPPDADTSSIPLKTPYPPSRRYRNATRAREICRINSSAVETRHLCQTGNRKNCHSCGDPHGTALSLTLTSETM